MRTASNGLTIGSAPRRSGSMVADARWVGGVYPLIHPEATDLGGASVRLKVRRCFQVY
jgi:hypothetical protein